MLTRIYITRRQQNYVPPFSSQLRLPPIFGTVGECVLGLFFTRVKIYRTCTVCVCVCTYSERVEARKRQDTSISLFHCPEIYHFTRTDNLSVRKNTPPNGVYYILLYCVLDLDLISRPAMDDHVTV